MKRKRVLIVFYSFTQQTRILLKKFAEGLEGEGIEVALERLEPVDPYAFPFKTNFRLAVAMVRTFFRQRTTIQPVSDICFQDWDCIVLLVRPGHIIRVGQYSTFSIDMAKGCVQEKR